MCSFLRFPYKCSVIFVLAISLSNVSYGSDVKESVKAILKSPAHDSADGNAQTDIWQQHAEAMRALMVDVFPVPALLTDYDYGYDAAQTMLRMDRGRALPLILKSAPEADPNVQALGFNEFITEYFGPPRNTDWAGLAHVAAIDVLENKDAQANTLQSALYVVGLTGDQRDFALLEQVYAQNNTEGYWTGKLRYASEAALARLGSHRHRDHIKAQLARAVPHRLNLKAGETIENSLHSAAFVGGEDFVPLICPHLNDPTASDAGGFVLPAQTAGAALSAIIDNTSPFDIIGRGQNWRSACQAK